MKKNEIIEKFKKIPSDINVVCIGTTQAHFAIDFEQSNIYGYNMALYKNPMQFSKLLLEKYKKKITEKAIILITLQYPFLCIECVKKIGKENAQQYAKVLFGKNPYVPVYLQLWEKIIPQRKNEQWNVLENMSYLEERNRYINHFKPWELQQMCRSLVENGWEKEIEIPNYVKEGHKGYNEKAERAMRNAVAEVVDLILYCKTNGWKPILVGLPYSEVLNQYIPSSFKEKCFYDNIKHIQDITDCVFWDFSMDERLQHINNYLDIWYLNEKGRKKFTEIIEQKILNQEL